VVARVGEVPILADDLRRQMKGGQPRDEALQSLIRMELLAQEAVSRGLHSDPAIDKVRRKAMANLVLQDFLAKFTKADIPQDLLQRAYDLKKWMFVHPELKRVLHILCYAKKEDTKEHHRDAFRAAKRLHRLTLTGPLEPEEFAQIKERVAQEFLQLKFKQEKVVTGRQGYTVKQFAEAAFKLKRPGQISPVTQTRFGYHVIYLLETLPPLNKPLSAVEDNLRDKIFVEARRIVFSRWQRQLERQHKAAVFLDVMDSVFSNTGKDGTGK